VVRERDIMAKPALSNSSGTPYDDWDGFGVETGFPNGTLPSTGLLQKLSLQRFSLGDLVLITGGAGESVARAMVDAGVYTVSLACNEEEASSPSGQCSSVTFLGGLDCLPLAAGRFAGAICFDRLSHLHRPRQAMEELHRILAPGGVVMFDIYRRDDRAYGLGQPLGANCFVVTNTLYRFFDRADVDALIAGLFEIIDVFACVDENHNCATYIIRKFGG
jgi:SAM-dependent methyltransferase